MTALAFALAGCAGDTTTYVKKGVQSVVIRASAAAVHVGDTIALTAEVTPKDAYYETVEWGTSDEDVLLIADSGLTAIAVGQFGEDGEDASSARTSEINVVIGGKKSGTITISVYNKDTEIPDDEQGEVSTDEDESEDVDGSASNPGSGSEPTNPDEPVVPGGTPATGVQVPPDPPTAAIPENASVEIVEAQGWFNSAYVIFKQVKGATYEVLIDDTLLDAPLIRYYNKYTYREPVEDETTLAVTYSERSYDEVVRADALGLEAGNHTIKVRAIGTGDTSTEYSTVTLKVVDHDRSGFAFTGAKTPGAYKADGTLKDNAVVIYLTDSNKSTVEATLGGTKYIGIPAITQAIKAKKISTPVDIRVIGTVTATASGKELSCSDMNSAWALGVKEASEVTIEGVGHDATLYGAGVAAFKSSYIEVANLGLMKWGGGKDGDGIALKGGAEGYIWVHHNDVFYGDAGSDGDQVKGDGSMDLKDDTKYVTIAYNHFWDSGKMSLCGMKSESGPNYITYHHNWFDHSDSRHPRIRTMTVHVYNNYFDGNSKYGVGVTKGASCFVEQNFFRNAHNPMMSSMQGTDARGDGTFSSEDGGVIKSYKNVFEQKNENGVKFQFITNKYDYTTGKELGEYKEITETIGEPYSEGGYLIYSWTYGEDFPSFISCTASDKSDKYQVNKTKTGFTLSVPANTTKVIVTAMCGSSGKTGTEDMLSVNGTTVKMNMADKYKDYLVPVSVSKDTTIEIANANKNNSMNVKSIKVIAATPWTTTYSVGADLTDIDAYEVDNRSDTVPAAAKAKAGGKTYSNFDVVMGDSGMGIKIAPTEAGKAKELVIKYSGRHNSDFAFAFNNAVDDVSYAKNDALNTALVDYKTKSGLTALQGE